MKYEKVGNLSFRKVTNLSGAKGTHLGQTFFCEKPCSYKCRNCPRTATGRQGANCWPRTCPNIDCFAVFTTFWNQGTFFSTQKHFIFLKTWFSFNLCCKNNWKKSFPDRNSWQPYIFENDSERIKGSDFAGGLPTPRRPMAKPPPWWLLRPTALPVWVTSIPNDL